MLLPQGVQPTADATSQTHTGTTKASDNKLWALSPMHRQSQKHTVGCSPAVTRKGNDRSTHCSTQQQQCDIPDRKCDMCTVLPQHWVAGLLHKQLHAARQTPGICWRQAVSSTTKTATQPEADCTRVQLPFRVGFRAWGQGPKPQPNQLSHAIKHKYCLGILPSSQSRNPQQ
jgi:hypothetical protein